MANDIECGVVASILDSGATLANASHAAAVIAGFGVLAHPLVAAARFAFAGVILCWFAGCWLAMRVRIDASLFRMLTEEAATRSRRMDELLLGWGFVKRPRERSIDERCRGALRLWRFQVAAFVIQCCGLVAGLIFAMTAGTG
jgi:hypothetical protein